MDQNKTLIGYSLFSALAKSLDQQLRDEIMKQPKPIVIKPNYRNGVRQIKGMRK